MSHRVRVIQNEEESLLACSVGNYYRGTGQNLKLKASTWSGTVLKRLNVTRFTLAWAGKVMYGWL